MHRPRILQCVSHLALGGAERVAITLIRELRDEFDFSVHAVRGVGDGEFGRALLNELHDLQIPVTTGPRVPMRFGGVALGAVGLTRVVQQFRPEIIHLHTEIPEASFAFSQAIVPSLRPIPLVRTIHNSVIWKFWPALGRECDRRLARARVAGVSLEALKSFHALRAASGAQPAVDAVMIYNGVQMPPPISQDPQPADLIRVVFGGRLEWEKGADLLPTIIAQTELPSGQRAHLTIFGSGRQEAALRVFAQHPPAGWTVDVQPPQPDFAQKLGRFDVALMPSRHEWLALVAIEALLARIQVVATAATGLREALPPEHPWTAQPEDVAGFAAALSAALAERGRWPLIAESGYAFAANQFKTATMAQGYCALYRQALSASEAARVRPVV
jgi:glycosyltransferase involved in cell wall biosynthesis